MMPPLRLLLLTDSDDNAQFVLDELALRGGLSLAACSRPTTASALRTVLAQGVLIPVIADFAALQLGAMAALAVPSPAGKTSHLSLFSCIS